MSSKSKNLTSVICKRHLRRRRGFQSRLFSLTRVPTCNCTWFPSAIPVVVCSCSTPQNTITCSHCGARREQLLLENEWKDAGEGFWEGSMGKEWKEGSYKKRDSLESWNKMSERWRSSGSYVLYLSRNLHRLDNLTLLWLNARDIPKHSQNKSCMSNLHRCFIFNIGEWANVGFYINYTSIAIQISTIQMTHTLSTEIWGPIQTVMCMVHGFSKSCSHITCVVIIYQLVHLNKAHFCFCVQ